MKWSQEQIGILTALGIRPETLCLPEAAIPEPGTVSPMETGSGLLEAEFAALAPFLPQEPRQTGATTNKAVFDALLWAQQTGRKLTQLPSRYGTAEAVRKRAERWAVAGVWDRIVAGIDSTSLSPAHRESIRKIAREHARRGERIKKYRSSSA